jgi:hypothetical protein
MATLDPDTLPLDLVTWRYATKAIAALDATIRSLEDADMSVALELPRMRRLCGGVT